MTQQGKPIPLPPKKVSIGGMLPKNYIPGRMSSSEAAQNQLRNYMFQLITNNARNEYPVIGPALMPMYEAEADRLSQPTQISSDYFDVARDVNNMSDRIFRNLIRPNDPRGQVGTLLRGNPNQTSSNGRATNPYVQLMQRAQKQRQQAQFSDIQLAARQRLARGTNR